MSVAGTQEVRAHTHGMWAAVANRWADHADEIDERGAEVTAALLAEVAVGPGDRVLELACGPGGMGIAAAELVGPGGVVVLSDVVPEMVSIAAQRAARRGLTNVRAATLDLEEIAEPDSSFDVVLCREGLMFAVEPDRAVAEIHRVLRPGGRLALAVWGRRVDNDWLGLVFDSITDVIGTPVPPPGIPGPFALSDEDGVHDMLEVAGFTDIVIERVPVPLRSSSFEAWWSRTAAVAGPITAILARLDATTNAALEQRLREAVAPYTTADGLDLPGVALVVSAHR